MSVLWLIHPCDGWAHPTSCLISAVSVNLSSPGQKGRWGLAVCPCLGKLKTLSSRLAAQSLAGYLTGGKATCPLPKMPFYTARLALSAQTLLMVSPVSLQQSPVLYCPWHQETILLVAPAGLVTAALQVSCEYKVCWSTAAQRELSYSAQKQIKPFIKEIIPGHLSLLSYLYSFLRRKPSTALCLSSKNSSIAGFSSPLLGFSHGAACRRDRPGKGSRPWDCPIVSPPCIPAELLRMR